jgi:hypothetical protein
MKPSHSVLHPLALKQTSQGATSKVIVAWLIKRAHRELKSKNGNDGDEAQEAD